MKIKLIAAALVLTIAACGYRVRTPHLNINPPCSVDGNSVQAYVLPDGRITIECDKE